MSEPLVTETRKKQKAMSLSIATALFLALFKFTVGLFTHSLAVMASAFDSLMDLLVSTVNFIAVKEADKPADEEHLYGHGKIESLAGLFQSILILISGCYLVFESVRRLLSGSELEHISTAIIVMVISTAVTFVLVLRLKKVTKETKSIIVDTETLHYTVDLLSGGGVILALVLVRLTGSVYWDLIVAAIIAVYIIKNAFGILRTSVDELLDRALPNEEQERIKKTIMDFDAKVVGVHEFRTRKIGNRRFIDFHCEIRGENDFTRAHALTESLIEKIKADYPGSDVTVHYDPEGAD